MAWAKEHTCDVCLLFGSPAMGGRLSISEGRLAPETDPIVQVRDGVVIDRDSGSARDRLKFDYEVTSSGVVYQTELLVDDPSDAELALLGAALSEWGDGFTLGGGTSRGLGRARARVTWLGEIDLRETGDRERFLLSRGKERWREVEEPDAFFAEKIRVALSTTADKSS
jgi:CRISPR/Cas system CSM-associated protein Csm3 (group 7 of RAMP superfamily)